MSALYGFWHGMLLHLWQTTLVLAIILVIDRILRDAPSRARHALWSVGLLKLFLPLSVFGGISSALARAAAGGMLVRGNALFPLPPVVAAVFDPIGSGTAPAPGSSLSYALVAATVCWGAAALYFISRGVGDAARAGRHGGAPLAAFDTEESRRLAAILDSTGIPRKSVILCGRFLMPTVVGLLRPRILVPDYLIRALSDEELRAILLHEDTHRRRRDPLRAAACRSSMALFFFYPLLYPVLRRLRTTAEFACDESVVHSGVPASVYARALAQTLELGLASPAFGTAAVAGRSLLRQRLRRLPTLNPRRYAMRLQYRILIALAAAVVAGATFLPLPMAAQSGGSTPPAAAQQTPGKAETPYPFDTPPSLVKFENPVYPEEGKTLGVQTTVLLSVLVSAKGRATEVEPVEAPTLELDGDKALEPAKADAMRALFVTSAVEAAKKWKFEAAALKGKPVPAKVVIPVRFKLH